MNKLFKYGLLSAVALLSFSCGDDFLEKPALEGSASLTSSQLEQAANTDPEVIGGLISGVYSFMFTSGTGGTTGHDDFGHKSYDIFGDMLSGDMALSTSTYGWYRSSITEFQAPLDFTFGDNRQVWRYYYRVIRGCNEVIDGLGGNDITPANQENKYIMGQAKALRAHSYFYLAQYYQKEYDGAEEILPFYTDAVTPNGPKVAAKVIYDQIEKDLTEAITLLNGFTRSNKTQINKNVAQGVYAYVLGARGSDYPKAYNMAVAAMSGYSIMPASEVRGGFNNLNSASWMWGVDLNDEIGAGLVSWWGQMDYFSYSYPAFGDAKSMDQALFDLIPANDERKGQFFDSPGVYEHLLPLNKFYDSDRTRYGSSRIVKADLVFMRAAEMALLAAEFAAKSNNDGGARTMLKSLVSKRVPDASYIDALAGQQLKNEIYKQIRIELWGEGKSYLAMKRNKATVTRGANHLSFVGTPIPYNDERMTFEIPEGEIQFNPFISTQNN
jgi:starch-binding outer membrane protein, SusD/RagB family